MRDLTEADLAWAAGFFDGEGTVYLKKSAGRHYPACKVTNTVRAPLDEFVRMFGGKVYTVGRKDSRLQCWQWIVSGARGSREFLEAVRPFLRIKGEQADVMLRFAALVREPGWGPRVPDENRVEREALMAEMSSLSYAASSRRHP